MKVTRLVLASSSPYRRQLLEKAGILVSCVQPLADESEATATRPLDLARARSELKGLSLPLSEIDQLAISADQVLEFADQAYGKVARPEEACEVLRRLSGQVHELHSAYSLMHYPKNAPPQLILSRVVTARMHMRHLSAAEIAAYVATDEWQGCAGCYQYENRGVQLFGTIEGELSTIVGLPIPQLLNDLRTLGINPLLGSGPWNID